MTEEYKEYLRYDYNDAVWWSQHETKDVKDEFCVKDKQTYLKRI